MPEIMPMAPLAELANITMGQSPDSALVNSDERGLPFLQGCAEFGARYPSARIHCSPPLRIAKAGSTLISVRAPVGTMNRADQDYCIGRGLAAILAKAGIADNVFLLNAIEQNISHLHRRSQGSTFLAIGSADLNSMPVAAPELPVQRRIAEILSTVDEAIEQTEALIAKTQQIRAGLMHDLFTRGVTADGQLRPPREEAPQLYKKSPLGWIPEEWAHGRLEDWLLASPKNGYSPREIDEWTGQIVLGLGCLTPDGFSPRQLKNAPAGDPRVAGARLADGDVLISRANTREFVGLVGIFRDIGFPCSYPDLIMRLRPIAALDVRFLELTLRSPFVRRQIQANAVGTSSSMVKISGAIVRRLDIVVPDNAEQQRIIEMEASLGDQIEAERSLLSKLLVLKAGLMQDLLTGRVAVTLGATGS